MLLVGLLALSAAACGQKLAQERHPTPTPRALHQTPTPTLAGPPALTPVSAVPPEVEQAAAEWPLAHKDYANTRAATDSEINAGSVDELGLAWSFRLYGASKWGSAAGGPLIAHGVVYFQDLMSNVYAFDMASGALRWEKRYQRESFGPNGPALGWGRLFVQDGINHVIALDPANGDELWSTELFGPTGANQPLAYGGYVYTGVASGTYDKNPGKPMKLNKVGTSGYAFGLDQASGAVLWHFQTIEDGFWGNPAVNSGAGIWFPPAIDTETGMTFWATGNPAPMPGTVEHPNASSRPGPNLYAESVLALDGRTGQMAWYYQVRPHDLLNYDLQNSPVLATAQIKGKERPVVIATGKMGWVYALDRQTGELYWQTPVGVHENDDLQELPPNDEPVMVTPGFWGGIESPAALADGVVYVVTENLPSPYTATAFGAHDGDEAVSNLEGRVAYGIGTAEVVALDVNSGKVVWVTPLPAISFGGATVVNDLLFIATYDGVIHALTRADGKIVWSYQTPGGIIAWPAVAADTIIWPVGLGREPVMLALRLGATNSTVPPAARALTTPTPQPALTPAAAPPGP
jgi:glucose dehydrogenase